MYKSSKPKMAKSKKKKALISIALVLALAVTGAVAFMTARDSAENKFTVGNVAINLTEPSWDENNAKDIVSGQIIDKDPTIENTGKNDAYVYMMVEIPKDTVTADEFYPLFSFTANEGWILVDSNLNTANDAYDYYLYGYETALTPGDTATLFNEVEFANVTSDFVDIYAQNGVSSFDIKVTGYAIQSDFYNNEAADATTAWSLYINQNEWRWPVNSVPNYVTYLSASSSPISKYIYRDYNGKDETTEFEINATPTVNEGDEFLGWVSSNGNIYQNGDVIKAEDLFVYDEAEPTKVLNINPVVTELVRYANPDEGNEDVVMLVPNYDAVDSNGNPVWSESNPCPTVIDRKGDRVSDYTANSEWIVYGLEEYLTEEYLLQYITVQGDGYLEIIPVDVNFGPYRGTGTTINVYKNSDNSLVESLKIVIFGDLNGDAVAKAVDATILDREVAGLSSWSNKESSEYNYARVAACDLDRDGKIGTLEDTVMSSAIDKAVAGVVRINQVTGALEKW